MRAGEVLIQGAIAGADVATFSSKIRPGIRALTIAVDEINSVSGMLQPGDRIDLFLSVRPPGQGAAQLLPEATAPLMQDLLVLATGRQVRPGGDDPRLGRSFTTITVEASPEEAQRLIVAQRGGKLTAMLRNPEDRAALVRRVLDLPGLLGMAAPKPLAPAESGPEIIIGGRGALKASFPLTATVPTPTPMAAPTATATLAATPTATVPTSTPVIAPQPKDSK
jgi:pilus assembly protein CpaB